MWARITFYGLDRNEHNEWTLPGISIIILRESHRGNIRSLEMREGKLVERRDTISSKPKISFKDKDFLENQALEG